MKKISEVLLGSWFFLGYLLSPVSWWNDLFVNIPLSYLFASLISVIKYDPNLFNLSFIIFYFLTNIIGLLIVGYNLDNPLRKKYEWKKEKVIWGLIWVLIYSVLIIALLYMDVLRMPYEYFR